MKSEIELKPGELYRHFKGGLYQVILVAAHSETGERMVVYQALYGDYQTYVRPYTMFVSEVDKVKYPKADQMDRFVSVDRGELLASGSDEAVSNQAKQEERINPDLLLFLDAEDATQKLVVLSSIQERLTERLMNSLEISLDLVGLEGSLDNRIDYVRNHLQARVRYENNRLR